jgi:hypothetical protein
VRDRRGLVGWCAACIFTYTSSAKRDSSKSRTITKPIASVSFQNAIGIDQKLEIRNGPYDFIRTCANAENKRTTNPENSKVHKMLGSTRKIGDKQNFPIWEYW